ncbi:hypothetical protein ACLOJK_035371 [Asimina triloba]
MEDSGVLEQAGKDSRQQQQQAHLESQTSQVLKVLEALKEASHTLQTTKIKNSSSSNSAPINALLELETEAAIFSDDPTLAALAHHLSHLKSLLDTLHQSKPTSPIRSFFRRRANAHHISRVAGSIESEIQAWIDRETVESLVNSVNSPTADDDQKLGLMKAFESRIAQGFDRELQDLVLKLKVFAAVESTLCSPTASKSVREQAAFLVAAVVQFNKNVFVGEVLMGPTVRALVSTATVSFIRVLCSLIRSIKSPLVEDMQSNRELPKIIGFLGSEEVEVRVAALDLVLEIGYFGRKEAVEEMVEVGLVKKLIELQRSDGGGNLIEMGGGIEEEEDEKGVETEAAAASKKRSSKELRFLERHPFASCVARFAIQLEVGEGLRQREKRALKLEVLRRVREAASSDAEAATILAEVLWGASP